MLRLRTLGGLSVQVGTERAEGAAAQRRSLALLALVAAAGEAGLSRDKILAYLWPEVDAERAGHRLRQALYALRRDLNADLLFLGSTDLRINPDLMASDVAELGRSLSDGDYERAVAVYGGPFLDGFHLDDAPEFEHWVERERTAWARRHRIALESLAEAALAAGEPQRASEWWRQAVTEDPLDERAAARYVEALAAAGNRAAALRFVQEHEVRMREELAIAPDAAVLAVAERLRRAAGLREGAPASLASATALVAGPAPRGGEKPAAAGPDLERPSTAPALPVRRLPAAPTPLVGRRRAVATLRELLLRPEVRLVTLTGAGGTGKTRLALEVAAQLLDSFAGQVHFVELAPLREPALVGPAIATALGVRETPGRPVAEALRAALAGPPRLLVLDNFEHVVAGAPLVAELLEGCSGLTVLATSRELLSLRGEHAFPVPPLAAPDPARLPSVDELARYGAVRLFTKRARAVRPRFRLTERNAAAVAGICARLDGLPLALELAAARIELLPPAALLERLGRPLELLTGGARDLPARQRTLRSAIAWSHELLSAEERTLFRRLSAFVGGFGLEAAQAVCAVGSDTGIVVLEALGQLAVKSLIRRLPVADAEPRFAMLETIREYGVERLEESGEAGAVRRAHADFYASFAERAAPQLSGPQQETWLQRLEEERGNLHAALAWSIAGGDVEPGLRIAASAWRFWEVRGPLREGCRLLEEAVAAAESRGRERAAPRDVLGRALHGLGALARDLGEHERAEGHLERGLAICREAGDLPGAAYSLNVLGNVAMDRGDYLRASRLHEESLALKRGLGDERGVSTSLNNLAIIAIDQGRLERAATLLGESLEIKRRLGDKRGLAHCLNNLGHVALEQGDYERAAALHEESLALRRELGDAWGVALSINNLADVALRRGDQAGAAALYTKDVVLYRDVGDQRGIAFCLEGLARVAWERAEVRLAARLCGLAEALRERIGVPLSPAERGRYAGTLAAVRASLGDASFQEARSSGSTMTMEEALESVAGLPDPSSVPA